MAFVTRKPRHITGRAKPQPDDFNAQCRAERAETLVETMWIETQRQRDILNAFRRYMRMCKQKRQKKGTPISGRRLSQLTQAGKSAIAERLIAELEAEAIATGQIPNPLQVLHITIDKGMTLKMLYQEILNRLADDFVDVPGHIAIRYAGTSSRQIRGSSRDNIKVFEQRVEEWVYKLNVELIVVDEIQRLVTKANSGSSNRLNDYGSLTADAMAVTEKLQAFLDRGVVPMVFIGDETSDIFFNLNKQFAARLLKPLKLLPLDMGKASDQKQFAQFCLEYDRQIVAQGATSMPTCLSEPAILTAMIRASGGHIGRAARIIQVALPAALERGAVTMEPYDLSNAVRDFAIPQGWVDYDPFSIQPDPHEISDTTDDAINAQ